MMRVLLRIFESTESRTGRVRTLPDRKERVGAIYDLGASIRNYAGELSMRSVSRGDLLSHVASENSTVKSALRRAVDAMERLSQAIFDTESTTIDISPRVRGALASEDVLDEAVTALGIISSMERQVDRAREYAKSVQKTKWTVEMAKEFRDDLERVAQELETIASSIKA